MDVCEYPQAQEHLNYIHSNGHCRQAVPAPIVLNDIGKHIHYSYNDQETEEPLAIKKSPEHVVLPFRDLIDTPTAPLP